MASLFSAILFLAVSFSFSHQIVADSARKELRSKLPNQVAPVQSNRIHPSRVVQLSWKPRVFIYRGFITDEECNHLISMAHKRKESNDIFDDNTKATGIMNSSDMKDDVVSKIEERISAWTFLPHENSRSLQVQHYTSELASGKYDYIGDKSTLEGNEPLMATVILYLSNSTLGGELVFPNSKVRDNSSVSATVLVRKFCFYDASLLLQNSLSRQLYLVKSNTPHMNHMHADQLIRYNLLLVLPHRKLFSMKNGKYLKY